MNIEIEFTSDKSLYIDILFVSENKNLHLLNPLVVTKYIKIIQNLHLFLIYHTNFGSIISH